MAVDKGDYVLPILIASIPALLTMSAICAVLFAVVWGGSAAAGQSQKTSLTYATVCVSLCCLSMSSLYVVAQARCGGDKGGCTNIFAGPDNA